MLHLGDAGGELRYELDIPAAGIHLPAPRLGLGVWLTLAIWSAAMRLVPKLWTVTTPPRPPKGLRNNK